MKFKRAVLSLSFCVVFVLPVRAFSGETPGGRDRPAAEEIMRRYYEAFYAPANDARIEAKLVLFDESGTTRTRRLTTWRLNTNPDGTRQKVLIYFHEPPDVKRLTIMVWKYPGRDDDRWMYLPAINLVRRLSARDYSQSFVGSDFTYEDGVGRDVMTDKHRLIREETIEGRPCYVVETTPGSAASWARQVTWISKETFLPVKQEFYDGRDELERVFTSGVVQLLKSSDGKEMVPTIMERTMRNVQTGHYSVFTFLAVRYNVGLSERDFKERYLKRPPAHLFK